MNKFYLCEQQALSVFISNRKSIDKIKTEKVNNYNIDFWSRLEDKAKAMDEILSFSPDGNTGFINIEGVLVDRKPDIYDAYFDVKVCSYKTINESISKIIDKGIKEVEIYFDTPGGMVTGVEECREYMEILSEYCNVTPIIKSLCCSGGVWIASGLNKKPIAMNRLSHIGSIGVVVTILDDSEFWSNWGIKEITLTNDKSSDKIPDINTINGQKIIIEELNAIYKVFSENVSKGFDIDIKKIDDLCGKSLYADDALNYGLIKSIGKTENNKSNTKNNSTPTQATIPESNPVIDKNEEAAMTLQELLEKSPDAKAEFDTLLESAKAQAVLDAQKNAVEILTLEKVNISTIALDALNNNKPVAEYAIEKLRSEGEKRESAKKENPFNALAVAQTPSEQTPDVKTENETKQRTDEECKSFAKSFLGGI